MRYINFNGELMAEDAAVFSAHNRLRMGDGFFESMRIFNGSIAFAESHIGRIERNTNTLQMELSAFNLAAEVEKLLKKNMVENGRVRIQFYRVGEGRYLPLSHKAGFVIEVENDCMLRYHCHSVNEVGISSRYFKSTHFLGNIKSSSALLYIMASLEAAAQQWCDIILLNEQGFVCEASSSNIFMVEKNGCVVTPPLSSGCVSGVMRHVAMEIIHSLGVNVVEKNIPPEALLNAQEVFFTNASKGIQSVAKIAATSYQSLLAERITRALNKQLLI